jgi:4'-phosphopantetheinyl transferase
MTTPEHGSWPEGPAAIPDLENNRVHIWRIPLDVASETAAECALWLSSDERQRADRYRFDRHRRRFVVCRAGQRIILSRYLGKEPAQLCFVYGERGKPSLAPQAGNRGLFFNVGNSSDLALCAVTRDRELGVDIEYAREVRDLTGLVTRFFAESEIEYLERLAPDERLRAFFGIWTQKEAVLKAVGTGLAFPLDQVVVSTASDQTCRVLQFGSNPNSANHWWLEALSPAPGYIGAIAAQSPQLASRCWNLDVRLH